MLEKPQVNSILYNTCLHAYAHSLYRVTVHFSPRAINCLKRIPVPGIGDFLKRSWVGGAQASSPDNIGFAMAFACLPELEGKALLLKTGHSLETGLGEVELELT